MNVFNYDEERGLIVTRVASKTLNDVKRVIANNRPEKGINATIAAYLPTIDPAQLIIEQWYEQHLLVESSDPNETIVIEEVVEDGETTIISSFEGNTYNTALASRNKLEEDNAWLKGLRGEDTEEDEVRPEYVIDVEQWKLDNKTILASYIKKQGVVINGDIISLTESNQNGLASVMTGINLAVSADADIFPLTFKAESPSGYTKVVFDSVIAFNKFCLTFMMERQKLF